ncbi:hypothetical protein [Photobacterium leiognathi]|uniref:hypothetical protein n=1 Tax=Photobacterium leiognathi TaxID=553611 RepID=UPI0029825E98|nr:hypothetical protein [Photobacterium leiognathi]
MSNTSDRKGAPLGKDFTETEFKEVDSKGFKKEKSFLSDTVDEKDRLSFAKLILGGLGALVLMVFICSYYFIAEHPNNKELIKVVNTILDITKTAVPSIVTLVLGFYFGKKDS